jgi:microcin C transport system substrate-binding protein
MKYLLTLLFVFSLIPFSSVQAEIVKKPSIAMHGAPKYSGTDWHFDYTNPAAPKGGTLKDHAIGTFDSLNPFIIKGTPAAGLSFLGQSYLYDSLMTQSYDEPFSMYGLLAETIEYDTKDNSWVAFHLNQAARWHDGEPVTPEDVIWSFNQFMEHGSPFFKAYYGDVTEVTAYKKNGVKFAFKDNGNKELPLILAQLAVLPKHIWTANGMDFTKTTLKPSIGSGPYKIALVEAGRRIIYERIEDYWGKDLPVNRGRFNFDRIESVYYKDSNIALEAFLAGEYDYRVENVAKLWETAYDAPAVRNGQIKKEEIAHARPQGMQAFAYNIRRDVFKDIRVREALSYAFDFEWSNKQFAFGGYKRSNSFFENSELAALDGPPTGRVLEILKEEFTYDERLPNRIFTERVQPPETDGKGNVRQNLRRAMTLLDAAGYKLGADGIRVHEETGKRLSFEIIDANPMFERWVLPFVANLKRIGVQASFRVLDPAQYQNRLNDYDFDMTILSLPQSSSPGNEQRDFWASYNADIPGGRNYIGIQDSYVDSLVERIIRAQSREELVATTRALDRVLLAGHYVIPHWHIDHWRIAFWEKLNHPETLSDLTPAVPTTWWATEN